MLLPLSVTNTLDNKRNLVVFICIYHNFVSPYIASVIYMCVFYKYNHFCCLYIFPLLILVVARSPTELGLNEIQDLWREIPMFVNLTSAKLLSPAMWCYCIAVKCNSLCSSIAPRWVSNQEGVMFPGLHAAEVAHGRFAHFELSSGLVRKGKHTAYTRYLEDLTKTILSIILQAPARQFAVEDNKSTTDWETWLYWPITPL